MKHLFLLWIAFIGATALAGGGDSASEGGSGGYRYAHTALERLKWVKTRAIARIEMISEEDYMSAFYSTPVVSQSEMIEILRNADFNLQVRPYTKMVNGKLIFGESAFWATENEPKKYDFLVQHSYITILIYKGINSTEAWYLSNRLLKLSSLDTCGITSRKDSIEEGINSCALKYSNALRILQTESVFTIQEMKDAKDFIAMYQALGDFELVGENTILHTYSLASRDWDAPVSTVIVRHKNSGHLFATKEMYRSFVSKVSSRQLMAEGISCEHTTALAPLNKDQLWLAREFYETLKANEHLATERAFASDLDRHSYVEDGIEGNRATKVRSIYTGKQSYINSGFLPGPLALLAVPVSLINRKIKVPRTLCNYTP